MGTSRFVMECIHKAPTMDMARAIAMQGIEGVLNAYCKGNCPADDALAAINDYHLAAELHDIHRNQF